MATLSPMVMTQLGTTMAAVSPFPVGAVPYVTKIFHIVNTSASPITVRVCLVPDGGTPSQANALLWDFPVPANDFVEFGQGVVVPANATVQALASAGASANLGVAGITA